MSATRSGQAVLVTHYLWTVVGASAVLLALTVATLQLEAQQLRADIVNQETRPYAVLRGAL